LLRLLTERLEIRDFRPSDHAAVHAYASDPEVTRYLYWGPNDESQTAEFLARAARDAAAVPRTSYELAVVERSSDLLVGSCGLMPRRIQYREFELGYCFRADVWGRGIATETVHALTRFGFATANAHRVYALVDPRNLGSSRVLEHVGYRREGLLLRDTLIGGCWTDSIVFALLEDEPLASG